jgi:hypothetical protein
MDSAVGSMADLILKTALPRRVVTVGLAVKGTQVMFA